MLPFRSESMQPAEAAADAEGRTHEERSSMPPVSLYESITLVPLQQLLGELIYETCLDATIRLARREPEHVENLVDFAGERIAEIVFRAKVRA